MSEIITHLLLDSDGKILDVKFGSNQPVKPFRSASGLVASASA